MTLADELAEIPDSFHGLDLPREDRDTIRRAVEALRRADKARQYCERVIAGMDPDSGVGAGSIRTAAAVAMVLAERPSAAERSENG